MLQLCIMKGSLVEFIMIRHLSLSQEKLGIHILHAFRLVSTLVPTAMKRYGVP